MDNLFGNLDEAYEETTRMGICSCKSLIEYKKKITNLLSDFNPNEFESIENRFKVLANETRLKIMAFLLKQNRSCICEIATIFSLDRSTLSYHLKLLKSIKLIKLKKVGKSKIISLDENYEDILPHDLVAKYKK